MKAAKSQGGILAAGTSEKIIGSCLLQLISGLTFAHPSCPDGGTGRRARLKIWFRQRSAGSIPVPGTQPPFRVAFFMVGSRARHYFQQPKALFAHPATNAFLVVEQHVAACYSLIWNSGFSSAVSSSQQKESPSTFLRKLTTYILLLRLPILLPGSKMIVTTRM